MYAIRSYYDRYCFSEAEFLEQNPEERMRRQFAADPLWGRGGSGEGDEER